MRNFGKRIRREVGDEDDFKNRRSTDFIMDVLARYYTEQSVSKLLVSGFQQNQPANILDLGVGGGSLLNAAYERWRNAKFYGADIDHETISRISSRLPFVNLVHIDGLSPGLPQRMKLKIGSVDVAICNPPYLRVARSPAVISLFKDVGLQGSTKLEKVTSDIVFLAQNLQMLRDEGELGIILPDSIFTGHLFAYLREDILSNHRILAIIQLPDNVFSKTEARTHILLIEKGHATDSYVPLYRSDRFGNLDTRLSVSRDELAYRMDYSYHMWRKNQKRLKGLVSLEDLGVEIFRGRQTKRCLKDLGINYFHTSSFPGKLNSKVKLANDPIENGINAEPGDILVARVGKRIIGRVTMVESGNQVITDCVYRLRCPRKYRDIIWESFISKEGQNWFNAHAHGVCSRVISKKDLLSFGITP
jgi:type I restriction enzyme M protein